MKLPSNRNNTWFLWRWMHVESCWMRKLFTMKCTQKVWYELHQLFGIYECYGMMCIFCINRVCCVMNVIDSWATTFRFSSPWWCCWFMGVNRIWRNDCGTVIVHSVCCVGTDDVQRKALFTFLRRWPSVESALGATWQQVHRLLQPYDVTQDTAKTLLRFCGQYAAVN